MSKTINIKIPTEFTVDHYQKLGEFEHLSDLEKVIRIVSAVSDYDEEEIRTWDIGSLQDIYAGIHKSIMTTEAVFLPVFEFKGIKYGLQPISKMSAGEYIDLDNKIKSGDVLDVISIIYRPLTEYKFDTLKWKLRSEIKFVQGKTENLFKYYNVEEYDVEKREWRKEIFKDLPMAIALGAYNFFLLIGIQSSNAILQSSQALSKKEKEMWTKGMEQVFKNIGDGSIPFTSYQKMEVSSD